MKRLCRAQLDGTSRKPAHTARFGWYFRSQPVASPTMHTISLCRLVATYIRLQLDDVMVKRMLGKYYVFQPSIPIGKS